jgi:hypothetical protein
MNKWIWNEKNTNINMAQTWDGREKDGGDLFSYMRWDHVWNPRNVRGNQYKQDII